jgi:hypothetical protein
MKGVIPLIVHCIYNLSLMQKPSGPGKRPYLISANL